MRVFPRYLLIAWVVRLIIAAHSMAVVDWQQTGDIPFYFELVSMSDDGWYPSLHFWTEYPPLFPLLITGLYRELLLLGLHQPQQFATAFSSVFTAVELVNIALVYSLVRRAKGERASRWAAAIYAGCPTLVSVSSGWFDPLAVLFTLAAVRALGSKRATTAGVLIGLGILTKIFPGVLLLAAPIALGWRGASRLGAAMLATLAIVIVPLAAIRPDLLLATVVSMVTRGPWETLPAIVSGYYGWGLQPPLDERFSAASAFATHTTPTLLSLLPESIFVLALAAAWMTYRQRSTQPHQLHLVAALGVTTFLIGNKGFSPQFVSWLIPFVLIAWPNAIGLAYVALLSAHNMVYDYAVFPSMSGYYIERRVAFETMTTIVTLSVVIRTLLMLSIAAHMFRDVARMCEWPRPMRMRMPMPEPLRVALMRVPEPLRLALSAR